MREEPKSEETVLKALPNLFSKAEAPFLGGGQLKIAFMKSNGMFCRPDLEVQADSPDATCGIEIPEDQIFLLP